VFSWRMIRLTRDKGCRKRHANINNFRGKKRKWQIDEMKKWAFSSHGCPV
jgi:hypothetical protein